jgi:phosphate starvation-induced protein
VWIYNPVVVSPIERRQKMIEYYYDEELKLFIITRDHKVIFATEDELEWFQVLDDLLD